MFKQRPDIVQHLPYLRRYARALLGSQERGDQYVRVCLETLLEEPRRMDDIAEKGSVRLSLFTLFHEVHDCVSDSLKQKQDRTDLSNPLDKSIQGLPPQQRQILLLTALEGFSVEDAATVLAIDQENARDLLHAARNDLNAQNATDVLIIEDEPVIAIDIANIVKEMGHTPIGMAATQDEAIAMAQAKQPGIVLADIQLSDGSSGIDAVQQILKTLNVPVVFVTAYPERLLTGEGTEPTYLVTKPFEPDVLKVTIHQALLSHEQFTGADAPH